MNECDVLQMFSVTTAEVGRQQGASKLVLNIANISVRLWQQLLQFKQLSDETEFISSHTFCCIQIFIMETKILEKKVELYSVSVYIGKISSSDKSGINLVIYSDTTALHCIGCFLHRNIKWSCLSTKFFIYNSSKSFSNRFSLCDSYIIYSLLDKKINILFNVYMPE